MGAAFAKHLGQQFRAAVGDQVLLDEVGRAVHQAHDLDDAAHALQVAHGGLQGAHQVDGHRACGFGALRGRHVLPQAANPGFAVFAGDVAREKNQVAGAHEGHVGGRGHGDGRQGDAELVQLALNAHDLTFEWGGDGVKSGVRRGRLTFRHNPRRAPAAVSGARPKLRRAAAGRPGTARL